MPLCSAARMGNLRSYCGSVFRFSLTLLIGPPTVRSVQQREARL